MKTMSELDAPKVEPEVAVVSNVETIAVADLLKRVQEFCDQDSRFVTATCLDLGDRFEVLYHFDKGLELKHLRVLVGKDEEVPSLSGIYLCAFLVENEMRELFGINITGIALDYRGRLLLTEECPRRPMLKMEKDAEST